MKMESPSVGALGGALVLAMLGGCRGRGDAGGGTDTDTDGTASAGDADGTDGETDGEGPLACPESLAPRQLRLLTRREYDATVHDLFSLVDPSSCSDDAQCPAGASCDGSSCVVETVPSTAFEIPGQPGWTSVHVAGSFNGWPATVAAGGWPLVYDAAAGTWSGTFEVPPGQHQYKLVVDESSWIPDPTNPQTADDGFGGTNSVLDVQAQLEEVPPRSLAFTDDLPVEIRPAGYAFDNNAAAGLVTSVHAEQYMRAAQSVAAFAVAESGAWLPCTPQGDGSACAQQVAQQVGRRIFRRPLDEAEVSKYAALVTGEATFDDGLRVALQAMLASPYFVYRFEIGEADGERFRLTGYELAAALSYGLWGTTPDDALLDAAQGGELDTAEGVEAQVRRLLDDPRARDQVGTFAVQWLGVEKVATIDKSADRFPGFDATLRSALLEETRRLAAHVVFDGSGAFDELLQADYTFVDATLAGLYGVEPPAAGWAQIAAPPGRAGILGHASVLAANAYPDQTSPVRRGLFVRRALLCQQLPDPPPDAGGVPDVDPTASTRERFEQHMEDAYCASCHQYIDPVGFGLEHFDPVGAWRDDDSGHPIDTSAELRGLEALSDDDVTAFSTVPELAAVVASSQAAPACFATHYFRYTHGRLETPDDACAVEGLTQRFAEAQHDVIALVVSTITAPEFRYRR
ncbi:MAG: DUF1592 domain-containing protein [Myxococcales bacterium]|nr:DUF1592 domain-containing protein [Myxococcales bacterium]